MSKKTNIISAIALTLTFVGISANSYANLVLAQDKPQLQELANNAITKVVIPNIKIWHKTSGEFYNSSKTFCKNPSEKSLTKLQNSFKNLYTTWNHVLPFDFGPIRDNLFFPKIHFVESYRQRGRDYTMGIKRHFNSRQQDDVVLDDDYFKNLKFTLVGMPAIEIILYEQTEKSPLEKFTENPRRCELLTGLSKQNFVVATYVLDGWEDGSSEGYKYQFFNNKIPSGETAATALIFAMQNYLRYVTQRKLNRKLDEGLADMRAKNLLTGLEAIDNAFTANQNSPSLQTLLKDKGKKAVSQRFLAGVEQAKKDVKTLDREKIATSYTVLIKMFEAEIPQALGVNLGMNFVDGD